MTGEFDDLIQQLGSHFELPLHTDRFGAVSLLIPPSLVVQIQLDTSQENVFLFSKLAAIAPGKFRENVLQEALRANGRPDPLPGHLAYVSSVNQLALCHSFPLRILNGERLSSLLGAFVEMALLWKTAIHQGQAAPQESR
jgi:hypothetical protein